MKAWICSLIVLSAMIMLSYGQPNPNVLWEQTYGGEDWESGHSVQQTPDGGYILGGYTASYGAGGWDLYLVKTDSNGAAIWSHTYGGWGDEITDGNACMTSDGGYVFVGETTTYTIGAEDFYLVKTDGVGNELWYRNYGGSEADRGFYVQQTMDGGYILAGLTQTYGSGLEDFYIIKTDSAGNVEWTQVVGGNQSDVALWVEQTTGGNYIVAGYTYSYGAGGSDAYLMKISSVGDTMWTRTYGGAQHDYFKSVKQSRDGNYVALGTTRSFGLSHQDMYLVKVDNSGDTVWTRTYGTSNMEDAQEICQTHSGGYIMAGSIEYPGGWTTNDFYLVKADGDGNLLWTRTYGGNQLDQAYSVVQTTDGGYAIFGQSFSFGASYDKDFYLVKTGPDEIMGPTPEIEVSVDELDFGYVLIGELAELPLMIYNVGDTTLVIYDIYASSACFGTLWQPEDSLIYPGDSLEVIVLFAPDDSTVYNETLSIENNDRLVEVVLLGVGLVAFEPGIAVSDEYLNFGFVFVGETEELPLTIYSVGTDTLILYGCVCGDSCFGNDFESEDSLLVPGDSLRVMLCFAPQQQMLYVDTMCINNNAELVGVRLRGYGIDLIVDDSERYGLPDRYALGSLYPNPFNSFLVIRYDLPVAGNVDVVVHDVLGRRVGTLVGGDVDAGRHRVVWDASDMTSGVYFVRMSARTPMGDAGEFYQTRKVVLLK